MKQPSIELGVIDFELKIVCFEFYFLNLDTLNPKLKSRGQISI